MDLTRASHFLTIGYVYGNPANWPFDHWIHQSPNVVVVSVYYRLDSFGFLSVPELAGGSLGDLNAGFQDQIQALKWVQQHIHSFGGDPTKVTINGESAGGSSVELHLVAHEGQKLFSQAIAQSVYRTPLPSPEQQRVHLHIILGYFEEERSSRWFFSRSSITIPSKLDVALVRTALRPAWRVSAKQALVPSRAHRTQLCTTCE